jgi:hypothetical protein
MLRYAFAAMILAGLAVPVAAAETPQQHCDRVIADANKGQKQALAAGHLYRYGKWQDVKCVKVDYVLAVEFYAKAGAVSEINSLLKELEYKLNAGQERARIAIGRLEAKGYIRVDKIPAP